MTRPFTIVTVAYHSRGHLATLIPRLDHRPMIIVDNGGGVGDLEGVDVLRPGRNLGFGAAVNLAVEHVTTPFFVIINPDSRPSEADLRALVHGLEQSPQRALCGALLARPDGRLQGAAGGWQPSLMRWLAEASGLGRLQPTSGVYERLRRGAGIVSVGWVAGTCLAVRTDVFKAIGGFDERYFLYAEDMDIGRRLHAGGYEVTMNTDVCVEHARGTSSEGNRIEQQRQAAAAMNRYLSEQHGALCSRLMQLIMVAAFAARSVAHGLLRHRVRARENAVHAMTTLAGRHGILRRSS